MMNCGVLTGRRSSGASMHVFPSTSGFACGKNLEGNEPRSARV